MLVKISKAFSALYYCALLGVLCFLVWVKCRRSVWLLRGCTSQSSVSLTAHISYTNSRIPHWNQHKSNSALLLAGNKTSKALLFCMLCTTLTTAFEAWCTFTTVPLVFWWKCLHGSTAMMILSVYVALWLFKLHCLHVVFKVESLYWCTENEKHSKKKIQDLCSVFVFHMHW